MTLASSRHLGATALALPAPRRHRARHQPLGPAVSRRMVRYASVTRPEPGAYGQAIDEAARSVIDAIVAGWIPGRLAFVR